MRKFNLTTKSPAQQSRNQKEKTMFTTEDTKITKFKKSFIRQYSETFVAFVCSLYGCLSSRCKSGHGSWLFARVVILDTPPGVTQEVKARK